MSEPVQPFLQILEAYRLAVYAKDVEAFTALYDDDVHVFDMWGAWSLRGIEAWREMASGWFSSLGSERVIVGTSETQATHAGALSVGHALLTFTAVSADGKKIRSLDNRITMALRNNGESWKIFHQHTSAPIDHLSTLAMLQR